MTKFLLWLYILRKHVFIVNPNRLLTLKPVVKIYDVLTGWVIKALKALVFPRKCIT